ncbi:MAG: hypothetical protein ABEI99_10830 [Halobaculum sp.]
MTFQLEMEPQIHTVQYDSRPNYTVSDQRILFSEDYDGYEAVVKAGGLVGERPAAEEEKIGLSGGGTQVNVLPIALSSRKRPMKLVKTDSPVTIPDTKVIRSKRQAVLTTPGVGRVEVSPGTDTTVTLPPRETEVVTKQPTDTKPDLDGVPQDRVGTVSEFGTTTREVTPMVDIVNHGKLESRQISRV